MTTYTPAADAPSAAAPALHARIVPSTTGIVHATELVEVFAGTFMAGILVLPNAAAHDLVTRLQDQEARLSLVSAQVAGHVRYVLEYDYNNPADEPNDWLVTLISLMDQADPEQRRALARAYPAYAVCVAIATQEGGLGQLAHFHQELLSTERPASPQAE
ncbi:hypothetical protein [Nonomuraea sediminis]|uniref:hypothetical protein n=1 Tax=Nonomuraea sediminis TaxID=2835864 RepID=UPI001BDC9BA6|nr:hypothetical protein [Nonomuraea sediminis]